MLFWKRADMSWICPCCRETVDDALEVCWQCGTATDGSRDPQFEHADEFEPEIPEPKPQYRLSTLVWLMFIGCLVFALFGSIANGRPNALTVIAGLFGIGLLALQVFSWLLIRRISDVRRSIRDSVRDTQTERRTISF